MKKGMIVLIACMAFLPLILGILFYSQLPERIVSHWDAFGEANESMGKFWGTFLLPLITLAIVALFLVIPMIDPLKKNIKSFRKYYDGFIIFMIIFMSIIQLYIMLWNIGIEISTNILFPVVLGALFFYLGVFLPHTKRNWFIGIRTPWTLSSDNVWDRTHKFGGTLLKIAGVITMLGALFHKLSILFTIVPVIVALIICTIYSYFVFLGENKGKNR